MGGGGYALAGLFSNDSYIHVPGFLRTESKRDDFVACLAEHRL